MYVAVKGGETAIAHSLDLLADKRRGDRDVAELSLEQIDQQLGLAVDRVMTEGSLLRPRAGGARHQAGARRSGRGDLPAARLSHDAAALRRQPCRSTPRRMVAERRISSHLQGRAGRPGAGPDLRLHPSAARFLAGRRRRAAAGADRAGRQRRRPCRGSATSSSATGCSSRRRHGGRGASARPDAPAARPAGRRGRCACRTWRAATRASCWRWATRPSAATATTIPSSARSASAACRSPSCPRSWASPSRSPRSTSPSATWSTSSPARTTCRRNSPAAMAWPSAMPSARRWPWRWSTARCAPRSCRKAPTSPAQDEEFVLAHSDNVEASGFVQHLKLPHYVDFQSELVTVRALRAEVEARNRQRRARPGGGVSACLTPRRRRRLQLRLSRRADQAHDPPRHPEGGGGAGLPGAVRRPRDAAALRLGHRRHPGDGRHHRPATTR